MEPEDVGPYVLLSNIYATEGRRDDVEAMGKMMEDGGLQKPAVRAYPDSIISVFPILILTSFWLYCVPLFLIRMVLGIFCLFADILLL